MPHVYGAFTANEATGASHQQFTLQAVSASRLAMPQTAKKVDGATTGVYPNPARNSVKLQFAGPGEETVEVMVFNTAGKLKYRKETKGGRSGNQHFEMGKQGL